MPRLPKHSSESLWLGQRRSAFANRKAPWASMRVTWQSYHLRIKLPIPQAPVMVSFPEPECTDYYVPPAEASYAGTFAGFVSGLLQLNVQVPESLPVGDWSLQLGFGGRSEAETVSLQVAVR